MPQHFKEAGYYSVSLGKVFHNMYDLEKDWSETPWRSKKIYHGEEDWAHSNTYDLWKDPASKNYVNEESGRGPNYEAVNVADTAYEDGKLAQKSLQKLDQLRTKDQPFFMAIGFWRPHLPHNAQQGYWNLYDKNKIELANNRFRPEGLPEQVTGSREITNYARNSCCRALCLHRMDY